MWDHEIGQFSEGRALPHSPTGADATVQTTKEESMKVTKTLMLIMLFVFAIVPGVHAACTNATAAGTFGFTTSGTLILPTGLAPIAAVGVITFDLNGNATGSQDRSVGGAFAHETINGTLTQPRLHDNPRCKRFGQRPQPDSHRQDPRRAGP